MASAVQPGNSNLERTRQQLQELDELLQQMLKLPLNAEEESPEAPAPPPPAAPRAAALAKAVPPCREEPASQQGPATTGGIPESGTARPRPPAPKPPLTLFVEEPVPTPAGDLAAARIAPASSPAVTLVEDKQGIGPAENVIAAPANREGPAAVVAAPAGQRSLDPDDFDLRGVADQLDLTGDETLSRVGFPDVPSTPPAAVRPGVLRRTLELWTGAFDAIAGRLWPVGSLLTSRGGHNVLGWIGLILLSGAAALALGGWLGWTP